MMNTNSIVFFQWFLQQALDPQAVIGIMKCLETKSLVLRQLLLLLVRIFYKKSQPSSMFCILPHFEW